MTDNKKEYAERELEFAAARVEGLMPDYNRENIKREMLFIIASELGMDVEMNIDDEIVIYTNLKEDQDGNLISKDTVQYREVDNG